ncbi:Pr6Pr family membrane protein [Arthrobacter castelli]|uniref:Pr6Pr family membrane protein n=1 Tax=Arthrobacter castelli TaxID=271431 RepID=UPI0004149ADA|nr:Pr6Pr family membrane protein [Arthrobacter castelli]
MRMLFLIVRVAALVTGLWALMWRADCVFATGTCLAANLFSYFTIHSNIMLVLVLMIAMYYGASSIHEPEWLTAARALTTTYMIVSGTTFGVLLVNADLLNHLFLVPLSSKVLHFVLPAYAVLDFLLVPARHRLHWSIGWLSMIFPLIWTVYTLIRGRLAGWYPYFFLNPDLVGGYRTVLIYAGVLAAFILLVSFIVVALSRLPIAKLPED